MTLAARSIHLMVRIQASQSWHRGSIPLSTTKYRCKSMICSDFFCSFAKNVVSLPAIELLNNKSELNQVLSNNIIKHYGHIALVIVLFISVSQVSAQSILHRADSILAQRYLKGDIDTAYVVRPSTKWTVTARMNVSGCQELQGLARPRGYGSHHSA